MGNTISTSRNEAYTLEQLTALLRAGTKPRDITNQKFQLRDHFKRVVATEKNGGAQEDGLEEIDRYFLFDLQAAELKTREDFFTRIDQIRDHLEDDSYDRRTYIDRLEQWKQEAESIQRNLKNDNTVAPGDNTHLYDLFIKLE